MIFGYGRSREKAELREQKLQLTQVGCSKIYTDDCSAKIIRMSFDKMREQLRKGDLLVVPSIYTFPLTLIELVEFFHDLHNQDIRFKSLREGLDDLSVFPFLHTYQKRSRSERAMANLNDGRKGTSNAGRPKGLSEEAKKEVLAVAELYKINYTVDEIMTELKMTSRSQVYKRIREAGMLPARRNK